MKKNILILALFLCGVTLNAQKPYIPWKEFKNDTLRYLKVNFSDNQSRYVGQRFENVLNDFELPAIAGATFDNLKNQNRDGAIIEYLSSFERDNRYKKGIPYHYLQITFTTMMSNKEYRSRYRPETATGGVMPLKDMIVKEIVFVTIPDPTPRQLSPELLRRQKLKIIVSD